MLTFDQKGWIFTLAMLAIASPAFIKEFAQRGEADLLRVGSNKGANVHSSKNSAGAELNLSAVPAPSTVSPTGGKRKTTHGNRNQRNRSNDRNPGKDGGRPSLEKSKNLVIPRPRPRESFKELGREVTVTIPTGVARSIRGGQPGIPPLGEIQ